MKPYQFRIKGMTCSGCPQGIQKALEHRDHTPIIQSVSYEDDLFTISVKKDSPTLNEELKKIIRDDAGFDAEDYIEPVTKEALALKKQQEEKEAAEKIANMKRHYWQAGVSIFLGLIFLILLALKSEGIIDLPTQPLRYAFAALGLPVLLYTGKKYFLDAAKEIKRKKPGMASLIATSALIAAIVSVVSLIVPEFHFLLDAALLIVGFKHLGNALQETADQALGSPSRFCFYASKTVEVVPSDASDLDLSELQTLTTQSTDSLKPGNIIFIRAGQRIPVDGTLLSEGSIDNTLTTGQNIPEDFPIGEPLRAGAKAVGKGLYLRVTQSESNSYLAQIDNVLSEVKKKKEQAPIERFSETAIQYFVPGIFALATGMALAAGFLGDHMNALNIGVATLAIACPCILGAIVPAVRKTGRLKAEQHNIRLTKPAALETAEKVDTIIFDLTGTLTEGKPTVELCEPWEKAITNEALFKCLHAIEAGSSHPFAKAICAHVSPDQEKPSLKATTKKSLSHSGIQLEIEGETYIFGNEKVMADHQITLLPEMKNVSDEMRHPLFLARKNAAGQFEVVGRVHLKDRLKPEAKAVIKKLIASGKTVKIATGMPTSIAHACARELNVPLENVHANCGGGMTAKLDIIKESQTEGHRVAMVGDAGNDVLAIAQSDLGIAVVTSPLIDDLTKENADVHLFGESESLRSLLPLFEISQQFNSQIKQNLLGSLLYNVVSVVLPFAILAITGGMFNPGICAIIMLAQAVLIGANVFRFKNHQPVLSAAGMEPPPPPPSLDPCRIICDPSITAAAIPAPSAIVPPPGENAAAPSAAPPPYNVPLSKMKFQKT